MKCVKCDICNKYVKVWHEVQNDIHESDIFNRWNKGEIIQIKDICLECKSKLKESVKKTVL